jgi:ERCC4-related helicase
MAYETVLNDIKPQYDTPEADTDPNATPIVIVTEFNSTMDYFKKRFGGNATYIHGGMTDKKKQQAIDDFQSGKVNICVINTIAAGVGITLTRSCNMIICDYDWTPANMTQVEDRICRAGQKESCNIYYMYFEDALIDRVFVDMITDKSANIDRTVDGIDNTVDLAGARDDAKDAGAYLDKLKEMIKQASKTENASEKPKRKTKSVKTNEEEEHK